MSTLLLAAGLALVVPSLVIEIRARAAHHPIPPAVTCLDLTAGGDIVWSQIIHLLPGPLGLLLLGGGGLLTLKALIRIKP